MGTWFGSLLLAPTTLSQDLPPGPGAAAEPQLRALEPSAVGCRCGIVAGRQVNMAKPP